MSETESPAVPPAPLDGRASVPAAGPAGLPRALCDLPAGERAGMPVGRIRAILADVAAALAPLHAAGQVHGGVSPRTVGLDGQGRAVLLAGPAAPAADAESAARAEGYAAFEQYTDDAAHPCGPWTDVYALAALAYALASGEPPPSALRRCVRDDLAPLAQRLDVPEDAAFAQAVDAALAMDCRARPATLAAFLRQLQAPQEEPGPAPEPAAAPMLAAAAGLAAPAPATLPPSAAIPPGAIPAAAPGSAPARVPLPTMLLVLAVVACALYLWWRSQEIAPAAGANPAAGAGPAAAADSAAATDPATGVPPSTSMAPAGAGVAPESAQAAGAAVGTAAGGDRNPGMDQETAARGDAAIGGGAAARGDAGVTGATMAMGEGAAVGEDAEAGAEGGAQAGAEGGAEAGAAAAAPVAAAPAPEPPPAPVSVGLDIRPWGEIWIDGQSRGVSPPLKQISLPPGKYAVAVRNPAGPEYRVSLDVQAGRRAAVSHSFD